jgi:hypothetical protein
LRSHYLHPHPYARTPGRETWLSLLAQMGHSEERFASRYDIVLHLVRAMRSIAQLLIEFP